MADKILILGLSGSGKTTSLRDLDPKSTIIINADKKRLPFKGSNGEFKTVMADGGQISKMQSNLFPENSLGQIRTMLKGISLKRPEIKTVVIDTMTFVLIQQAMARAKERGFDKYQDFASEVWELFNEIDSLREDLMIIIMAHVENRDGDDGRIKAFKIPAGKFHREKGEIEGMFTVVLMTYVERDEEKSKYYFLTQNDGTHPSKSPMGMFKDYMIPNDMKFVLDSFYAHYNGTAVPEVDSSNF